MGQKSQPTQYQLHLEKRLEEIEAQRDEMYDLIVQAETEREDLEAKIGEDENEEKTNLWEEFEKRSEKFYEENQKWFERKLVAIENRVKRKYQTLAKKDAEIVSLYTKDRKLEKSLLKNQINLEKLIKTGNVPVKVDTATPDDTKILQAFSYTVFDTILFSITQGASPDFTLLSQSALFDTVYINIARGYDSYLFNDIPASAPGIIIAGRNLLENLREDEDRYLDEEDLWGTYAPVVQTWWINTALPILFGERDPDWDSVAFPTYDEMQLWNESELNQRKHFPAIADLVELAKQNAMQVADTYNFKPLLNA